MRFRVHEVVITAKIQKAFLDVEIDPEHRDFLRFLWVDDINKESPEGKLLRFVRVVFDVNSRSIPSFLMLLRHPVNTCRPDDSALAKELLKSLYVD